MDWTYDMYVEDVNYFDIEDKSNGEYYNEYFVSCLKKRVRDFLEHWNKEHDGKMYDHGWAGDAFASELGDWFSDFYKDTYNQRPHLPIWYYVYPLGLPMQEDTSRLYCATPVADAMDKARLTRVRLTEYDSNLDKYVVIE